MKATGMTIPLSENQLSYLPKDVVAYMKLRIIAAALNELHEATLEEFPKFTKDELATLEKIAENSYEAVELIIQGKTDRAMNLFN